jgi:ubiquinone/menaquinone biosynthesis C-methylase UbiE
VSGWKNQLFDEWPDQYDRWFETPIGLVVKTCESSLIKEFLMPLPGETIVDGGCGTGIFTLDVLASGARVVGLDLSFPMLSRAAARFPLPSLPFYPTVSDMMALPFRDNSFDKAVSITALEFIEDAGSAVKDLFRVTKSGGAVVVATLNSLSPWAVRRKEEAEQKETIFSKAIFRSPQELLALTPFPGIVKTAVHFQKDSDPEAAIKDEEEGRGKGSLTGAFVAVRWQKP